MNARVAVVVMAAALGFGCGGEGGTLEDGPRIPAPRSLTVTGPFEGGDAIPTRFTCDGADISPELGWAGSDDAREFALLVTDPDAPDGTFVHWVVYGIDSSVDSVAQDTLPEGGRAGINSFGDAGYGGPCPPEGDDDHRYRFTVYALDQHVSDRLNDEVSAKELLVTIECCTRAHGTLTGTYGRS